MTASEATGRLVAEREMNVPVARTATDAVTASGALSAAALAPPHSHVLMLQRKAGNAAVVHMLQRDPPTDLGGGQTLTTTDRTTRTGPIPTAHERAAEVRQIDPVALGRSAHSALSEQIRLDRAELQTVETRINQRDRAARSQPLAGDAAADQAADEALANRLNEQVNRRQADLDTLTGERAEEATIRAIVTRNGLRLGEDAGSQVVAGRRERSAISASSEGVTASNVTTTTTEQGGAVEQTVRNRSIGTGGAVSTTDRTTTTTSEGAGLTGERRERQQHTLNLGGYVGTRETRQQVTDVTGAQTTDTRRRTAGVALGSGQIGVSVGSRREESERSAAGDVTRRSRATTGGASIVHGESGTGVGANVAHERGMTTAGGLQLGMRAGTDGRFTTNVEQLDTFPPTFRVTTTLHLGARLGGSAQRAREEDEGGYRASGSVSAAASGDLVFRRTLSEAEARSYLGNLENVQSGQNAEGRPEFGILARMRAIPRGAGGMQAHAAALLDPSAARELSAGDAVDLNLSATGDIAVGLGTSGGGEAAARTGVSIQAGAGRTRGRRIRVERRDRFVLLTITASGEERRSVGGNVSAGYASMGATATSTEGGTQSFRFRLDPASGDAFDQRFNEITRLMTADSLRAYAQSHSDLVDQRTQATSASGETGVTAGIGPASIGINQGSSRESSVTSGREGISATVSGGQTTTVNVGVGSVTAASGTRGSSVSSTVGESGIETDLTRTSGTSSLSHGIEQERERQAGRRPEDVAAGIAAQGPGNYLQGLLNAQATRLTTYRLSDSDFGAVVTRASDARGWERAMYARWQLIAPWTALRAALTNPSPLREWVQADHSDGHTLSTRIAQATALADFMSAWGEQGGYESVENVLRRWGQIGLSIETGPALGVALEWPPSLARTQVRFEAVRGRLGDIDLNARLEALVSHDNAADEGRRFIDTFRIPLQQSIVDVDACTDFEQPRAKLEMLRVMHRMLRQVTAARRRFERMLNQQMSVARPAGDVSGPELAAMAPPERLSSGGPEPAPPARDPAATERLQAEISSVQHTLDVMKSQERHMLDEARGILPRSHGGTLSGGAWDVLVNIDGPRAAELMRRLADSDVPWIESINRLRGLLRAFGDPPASWPVKPGPTDAPRRLDPDIETMCRLYLGGLQQHSLYALNADIHEGTVAQWRARGRY